MKLNPKDVADGLEPVVREYQKISKEEAILDLLKRLEAKGMPLRRTRGDEKTLWLQVRFNDSWTDVYLRDSEPHTIGGDWLIIGCVVEYMEAQGYSFVLITLAYNKSYKATFTAKEVSSVEYADTLLEAVLAAADKALR